MKYGRLTKKNAIDPNGCNNKDYITQIMLFFQVQDDIYHK